MFNTDLFLSLLETRTLGRNFHYFGTLPSTNDHAKALMENGKADSALVLAETQTEGRGRQGKVWDSPPGAGLYFSLAVQPEFEGSQELLTLRTGLILAQVAEEFIQEEPLIKWPNDLWINGRKTAGILVESRFSGNRPSYFIIGIGINVIAPPNGHPADRHYLFSKQEPKLREKLLGRLINRLETELYQPFSMETFRRNWKCYDLLQGKPIRVLQGTTPWQGVARGIDENGHLLVEKEGEGLQKVNAAEVSVRPEEGREA